MMVVNRIRLDKNFTVVFENIKDDFEDEIKKDKGDKSSKMKEEKVIVRDGSAKKDALTR